MRYSLIFSAYEGAQWNFLTNSRHENGVVPTNPLTKIDLLPVAGDPHYQLRIDGVPIGTLIAIVRDTNDEAPPTAVGI